MSNELRELLDTAVDVEATDDVAAVPPSETVTTADRWTRRAGERLVDTWAAMGLPIESDDEQSQYVAADSVETLLSTAPSLAEKPADEHRARWWRQLLESPELNALRAQTVCAPALAELGAAEITQQWLKYAAQNPPPDEKPEGDDDGDDNGADGDESPEATIARMRSTRAAVEAAQQAADEGQVLAAGLGLGTESSIDAQRLAAFTRRLKQSGVLARIMQLAGRFIARAAALQKQRTDLPGLEVTGVELSGDIERVLPLEAALVAGAVPEIETLALYRLATRRTLSYRRHRREPVGMGPIVVSVDESSSMKGEKIAAAKGLALAMASIARAQKRPAMFAAFSGSDRARWASDAPDEIVQWCELMMGGGTELDVPLAVVPQRFPTWQHSGRADHIIITDAIVSDTPKARALVDSYRVWAKQHNVRTFAIVIGPTQPGIIADVADGGCWCVKSLDLDSVAIETVLSIGPTTARSK